LAFLFSFETKALVIDLVEYEIDCYE